MKLYLDKKTILGCREHSGGETPFLTRYTLARFGRFGKLCLHVFHRSDMGDVAHDHPWSFVSLILWGGYWEHTPDGKRRRKIPGMILVRPATWVHWTENCGKVCISLLWMSDYHREWGFYTPDGWVHWREFFKQEGC